MTAFFILASPATTKLQRVYSKMRTLVEADMGRRPSTRRIAKLWARRGSLDCTTEVGSPDPLRGGTVLAIFDMGPRQPFVVWRQADVGVGDGLREVLGPTAYSVMEFDS